MGVSHLHICLQLKNCTYPYRLIKPSYAYRFQRKAFNVICEAIDIENTALANDIKAFKKSCSDKYTEAMDNMDEWYLESSLYAEFALNESGSLTSYRTQKDEYDVKIKRYQKIAESYE